MLLNSLIPTGKPANRLIIGDVGSGKTLVAMMSLLSYVESFYTQVKDAKTGIGNLTKPICVVLMSPTEVLASQHYQKLLELIQLFELDWLDALLLTNKQKLLNNEKITPKKLDKYTLEPRFSFWIGTHALLYLKDFNPVMIVTDEQHRFGVRQRQNLSSVNTSEHLPEEYDDLNLVPHYVSMTATPIPRTLALTVFGDLKASYIKKIETRVPIQTEIVLLENFETRILPIIRDKLAQGQKVFVICPAIDPDEEVDLPKDALWNITSASKFLAKYFKSECIATLHGKLGEKYQILEDFKVDSNLQILVSTTVIEVGVDITEASIMLIFNPERFGLAQLHQIRGRVGRNSFSENYCFLLADNKNIPFLPRLQFLCRSNDGFEIAQEDLRLRGQGDIYGTVQSGQSEDLIGLDPKEYQKIRQEVDKIDLKSVGRNYPKLEKYLIEASNQVWRE